MLIFNYLKIIWLATFFDLTSLEARAEILKKIVGILVEMMTPKGNFEINWPLNRASAFLDSNFVLLETLHGSKGV